MKTLELFLPVGVCFLWPTVSSESKLRGDNNGEWTANGVLDVVEQNEELVYNCNNDFGSSATIIPLSDTILIENSDLYSLCVLMRKKTKKGNRRSNPLFSNSEGNVEIIARSYSGNDWEIVKNVNGIQINCDDNDMCQIDLSTDSTEPFDEYEYILNYYDGATTLGDGDTIKRLSPTIRQSNTRDTIARFLDQTTFGVTRQDLTEFGNQPIASWINNQMFVTPMTSHREFWRTHMTARHEFPSEIGTVTHPCQMGTKYRLYAFTNKDIGRDMVLEKVLATGKIMVSVNGFVRTIVSRAHIVHNNAPIDLNDGSYQICDNQPRDEYYLDQEHNSPLQIRWVNSICYNVWFNDKSGNTNMSFDWEPAKPNKWFDLNPYQAFVQPTGYYGNRSPTVQEIVLTRTLQDLEPQCPNFEMTGNPEDPVFVAYDGQFWIHDPRFELHSNTPDAPLVDGGGANVIATEVSS